MRSIRRRMEALQKATSARRDTATAAANRALEWLGSDQVEMLISALGAERAGHPLTERESAARQVYTHALRREYQWARLVPATNIEHSRYLYYAILVTLAQRCSPDDLDLLQGASCATQQGGQPTEQESAAVQVYVSELKRLCDLAGFESTEEFRSLGTEAARGDR
jgi:hypothetical protein